MDKDAGAVSKAFDGCQGVSDGVELDASQKAHSDGTEKQYSLARKLHKLGVKSAREFGRRVSLNATSDTHSAVPFEALIPLCLLATKLDGRKWDCNSIRTVSNFDPFLLQ